MNTMPGRNQADINARLAHLEGLFAQLTEQATGNRTEKQVTLLAELDKRKSMTMKDISSFLGCSIQTAHVISRELMRRKDAVMVFEPWGKNHRLRIVSTSIVPTDVLFDRVRTS